MTTMASQITSLTVVYSTVYSDADQRKHQRSASSLAFVWGFHRDRWIPLTKGQLRGKSFRLMTSSCVTVWQLRRYLPSTVLSRWRRRRSVSDQFSAIAAASRERGNDWMCIWVIKVRRNVLESRQSRRKPRWGSTRRLLVRAKENGNAKLKRRYLLIKI